MYYDDGLDFRNSADSETILKRKQKEREERIKEKKELNKSYLKGQRGKRLYYDYDKTYLYDYEEENKEPQVKCIFTKDLRREKLFAYLKYLKGRKVLVRDLAWKFAVTERTIQSDLKFLIDNGYIERQLNKTFKGRQTKNSYIVHPEKQKELAFGGDKFVVPIFVSKQNDNYFVCVETDYNKTNKKENIEDCFFTIRERKIDKIEDAVKYSLQIAKEIFVCDIKSKFFGIIGTIINQGTSYDKYHRKIDSWRDKNYFTLTLLDELYQTKEEYKWISLKVAPRRIKNYYINKGIHQAKRVLGVK